MLILLNVLSAFAYVLDAVVTLYMVILFARVVLSWVRLPYNQIVHMIYQATEPVLRPIRRRMPLSLGIDFSPMIVFMLLIVIRIVVVGSIYDYVQVARMRQFQHYPLQEGAEKL